MPKKAKELTALEVSRLKEPLDDIQCFPHAFEILGTIRLIHAVPQIDFKLFDRHGCPLR